MSIKSLLVYLHPDQHSAGVLDVAVGLARRHNAHLAGLHVVPGDSEQRPPACAGQAEAFERVFRERAEAVQLSHEWCCMKGEARKVVALESRCHDLLIIGQADPTAGTKWARHHQLLEDILIKSGHSLIAVPYSGSYPNVGDRILIAWNGTREVARATEGAMSILEKARRVITLTLDLRHGDALSVDHFVRLLERHDVEVEARGARSHGKAIGDALLSEAVSSHCDLLVMGGYGHSRTREHLFGGPTFSVVQHMTVPVLIAH